MAASFYFYDLETSSGWPRTGRIMQFAGQRTDMFLKPMGEPDNFLVKLAPDVLPEPEAILVHGITPQQTLQDGLSEAELVEYFKEHIALPGTIFVGYNNVRFDDEFMRGLLYRSLCDPYTWHWQDGRSRWDLLDAMRMMRALRPEGLEWPFSADGSPTVRLGSMSAVNNIDHVNAHDALGDVVVLVELAKRFKKAQPKLFSYLLEIRDKKKVAALVEKPEPFLYTSGKYSSEFLKTALVINLCKHPSRESAIVYDLRFDPVNYIDLSPAELAERWRTYDPALRLPLKTLQYNRCPAVAPTSVLDDASKERLKIDLDKAKEYHKVLANNPDFVERIQEALGLMDQTQASLLPVENDVDTAIYDGFWSDVEKKSLDQLCNTPPEEVIAVAAKQPSKKIEELAFRFIARNYSKKLTPDQRERWEAHLKKSLLDGGEKSRFSQFFIRLSEVMKRTNLSSNDQYLLTELQLYAESIMPEME